MASPFPDLQIHPGSGLSFAWAEHIPGGSVSSFDAAMGPDGVRFAMVILIQWEDISVAIQELLGYSWRDDSGTTPRLRRVLPWQHPYNNQLWVKEIASFKGLVLQAKEELVTVNAGGAGDGSVQNTGPWSNYRFCLLTLHFWRPPYYIRSDADILDADGEPQEWLRFVDKNWQPETQFLSREGNTFVFSPGMGAASGTQFQGSVGQKITKLKVKRTWYQIPERALFNALVDQTPNGLPDNMIYTQTATVNPITGYIQPAGYSIAGCVNSPKGGGLTPTGSWDDADADARFFGCYEGTLLFEGLEFVPRPLQMPPSLMQIPIFSGNEPISQVQYDVVFHFEYFDPPTIRDEALIGAILGVKITAGGTGYASAPTVSFTGGGGSGAAATCVVVDGKVVRVMMTNYGSGYTSDPTVGFSGGGGSGAVGTPARVTNVVPDYIGGHNLMPYSGNGLWYPVQSQQVPITTPFQYADFTDLFKIL